MSIRNLARESGIPDPHLISGNSLRKQIATVMQLLHLSPTDEAEFAKFMGHTEKTHNEFYKLGNLILYRHRCKYFAMIWLPLQSARGISIRHAVILLSEWWILCRSHQI